MNKMLGELTEAELNALLADTAPAAQPTKAPATPSRHHQELDLSLHNDGITAGVRSRYDAAQWENGGVTLEAGARLHSQNAGIEAALSATAHQQWPDGTGTSFAYAKGEVGAGVNLNGKAPASPEFHIHNIDWQRITASDAQAALNAMHGATHGTYNLENSSVSDALGLLANANAMTPESLAFLTDTLQNENGQLPSGTLGDALAELPDELRQPLSNELASYASNMRELHALTSDALAHDPRAHVKAEAGIGRTQLLTESGLHGSLSAAAGAGVAMSHEEVYLDAEKVITAMAKEDAPLRMPNMDDLKWQAAYTNETSVSLGAGNNAAASLPPEQRKALNLTLPAGSFGGHVSYARAERDNGHHVEAEILTAGMQYAPTKKDMLGLECAHVETEASGGMSPTQTSTDTLCMATYSRKL